MLCFLIQDEDIHLASRNGHVQVVENLINSGADVDIVNKVCGKHQVFDMHMHNITYSRANCLVLYYISALQCPELKVYSDMCCSLSLSYELGLNKL